MVNRALDVGREAEDSARVLLLQVVFLSTRSHRFKPHCIDRVIDNRNSPFTARISKTVNNPD
jgi:hypothetical protein